MPGRRLATIPGLLTTSRRLHVAGLIGLTLLVLLAYDLPDAPIIGDRALFVYLGQTVLRGESIYGSSTFNYLPLGPILGAVSMWIGGLFGVPSYLAPRFLAALVAAGIVVLTYDCTRRVTGRAWCGLVAGLVLCGISILARFTTPGLEPKVLVLFLGLVACSALQRRSFMGLGIACSLGVTCWQPFAPVALAYTLQTMWVGRRRLGRCLMWFSLGVLLGALPVATYLTLTASWADCWQVTVVYLSEARAAGEAERPFLWLTALLLLDEAAFVWTAGLGIAWFAVGTLRRGPVRAVRIWLSPRLGGVPAVTLAWAAWSTYSFDYFPDALPFLWVLAFWTGWLAWVGSARLAALLGGRASQRVAGVFAAVVLVLTSWYGFSDVPAYKSETTLAEQAALSREIVEAAGPDATLACIAAEEFYLFDELRSPYPFLRLKVAQQELSDDLIRLATGMNGCAGVIDRTMEVLPVAFVISSRDRRNQECVSRIAGILLMQGYQRATVTIEEAPLNGHRKGAGHKRGKAFLVYLPPGSRDITAPHGR